MNRATLTIGGVDYSHKLTYSVKWAQLLDERLDEAEIFLKNVKRADPFTPLDIAEMTIYNAPDTPVFAYKPAKDGVTQSLTNGYLSQTQSLQFVVAND